MNIGLLGYGGWGKIHAASVAQLERHRLVAIACRSEETAQAAQKDHPDCFVSTDYHAVIERGDVEAVDCALPTHLHVPAARAVIAAGKPLLLEKPMAGSLEEADRLVEAASAGSVPVSMVHELRVSEQWAGVKKVVAAGEIGVPRYALLNLFRFPYRSGASGWRYHSDQVGSWVLEEPIHFIDLVTWYLEEAGAPVEVRAFANLHKSGLSQDFTAVLTFESGAYGVISQTLSGFEHHQVAEITGSHGAVRSTWSGAMDRTDKPEAHVRLQRRGSRAPEELSLGTPSGELFEISLYLGNAFDAFGSGQSVYTLEQERELVRICLAAERSAREGRPVKLKLA